MILLIQAMSQQRKQGTKMYAHYCNDKTVRITSEVSPVGGQVFQVSGKREARAIAAAHNAQPWNF